MRIGVLTGGGDVPGLNPCIRSIALSALDRGWDVTGFRRGWQGFLEIEPGDPDSVAAHSIPLDREAVRGIDRVGGTMLHTSRTDPRTVAGGDRTAHVLRVLEKLEVDALITLGGDGTLRFSAHLSAQGFPVISIPKTMDNDVFGTDYCIGFSTAITRSVDAINALRTTAESHERIAIVELFGRRSGETALLAGFLAQVDRTVIAEVPADPDTLLSLLADDRRSRPGGYAMCVISEGARLTGEDASDEQRKLSNTQRSEAAVSRRLALMIEERSKERTIVQQLAYLMRSGDPDALDRMVGFAFGGLAIQKIEAGETGRMLALRDGNYCHVPIDTLLGGTKTVDVEKLYDVERYRPKLTHVEGMPMFLY
ncbi:ATP-dependent 6-phosphofructokinase [Sphingomonadaceae bacterium G21617-S1]|nr:ATP-dependent 6-phosphofructokinase [Sphingomonadaceae bacterium G21617-S1]